MLDPVNFVDFLLRMYPGHPRRYYLGRHFLFDREATGEPLVEEVVVVLPEGCQETGDPAVPEHYLLDVYDYEGSATTRIQPFRREVPEIVALLSNHGWTRRKRLTRQAS